MNCPSKAALYCGQYKKPEVVRYEKVEGHPVKGIVLETGFMCTLVRKDLVPQGQETGGEVSIRCAHRVVMTYQLAEVKLEVGGKCILVEAGVAPNLPAPVLLGTDVHDLAELPQSEDRRVGADGWKRREESEVTIQAARELQAVARPSSVEDSLRSGKGTGQNMARGNPAQQQEEEPEVVTDTPELSQGTQEQATEPD